jgi:hypothetical protein
MRRVLLALLVFLGSEVMLAVPVVGPMPAIAGARPKPATPAPFTRPEEVLAWAMRYRQAPEPERLPQAVAAMAAGGLTRNMDEAGFHVGFVAGVLGDNPHLAERLVARFFPLDPLDQVLVVKAIAHSGLPDWKGLLARTAERMPARAVLIGRYLARRDDPRATPVTPDGSAVIDMNWGYYYATGDDVALRRIVATLAWSENRDDVEKLTLGAMAKWTLAQNAARDLDLLARLKAMSGTVGAAERQPLREAIDAAETLELGRLRKRALASIEELRSKGPDGARRYAWWSQAGQTALGLGCVTAAVLGQAQFGIPCVVGGALASAALRYLGPEGARP